MDEFREVPSDNQKELMQSLLDAARGMRDIEMFNNPMVVDFLGTPELDEYLEETFLMDRDRWN